MNDEIAVPLIAIVMKDIDMILFDVDNTLVYGRKASLFYRRYAHIIEKSLAEALGVELLEGKKIAREHRAKAARKPTGAQRRRSDIGAERRASQSPCLA